MQHALSCYLLVFDLHAFVRGLLESLTERTNQLLYRPTPIIINSVVVWGAGTYGRHWTPLMTYPCGPSSSAATSCSTWCCTAERGWL